MRLRVALLVLPLFLSACGTTDSSDPPVDATTDTARADRGRQAEDLGNGVDAAASEMPSDIQTFDDTPVEDVRDASEISQDAAAEPDVAVECPVEVLGYNTTGAIGTGIAGSDAIYAVRFTLAESSTVERLEIMTGGPLQAGGELTLGVYGTADGLPSTSAAASATVAVQDAVAWQGVDLSTPNPLDAGDWWLVFSSTVDLLTPQAASGTPYTHVWGFDHGDWIDIGMGPYMEANWMIRVVGCPAE